MDDFIDEDIIPESKKPKAPIEDFDEEFYDDEDEDYEEDTFIINYTRDNMLFTCTYKFL